MHLANQLSNDMSYEQIFDQSYERIKTLEKDGKRFFAAFYDNFLRASPDVAEHFRATDMERQMKMMEKSFYGLFIFYATQNANDYLENIAEKHSHYQLNIDTGLYDIWLNSLIETVKYYDPEFTEDIALAWRVVLAPGIAYMKHRYDRV